MERRTDLDFIKGFSIIAVILYHVGILPYGYLGVDVFLVISGFLIIPPVLDKMQVGDFQYSQWLWKRFMRFLPLVIFVCAVSMILGYYVMMPDDYENLAQSSIASELFANNILLSITSKNYWASANEYKPLLGLWYLGIVAQFFVIFPLIFIGAIKIFKKFSKEKVLLSTLYVITVISFILYTLPIFDFNQKFYYLPFRMWEFCVGACAFYIYNRHKSYYRDYLYVFVLLFLLIILSLFPHSLKDINHITHIGANIEEGSISIPKSFLQISTVFLGAFLIIKNIKLAGACKCMVFLGKMSLSLFLWHQVVLAFMRYSLFDNLSLSIFICYLISVFIVSIGSYYWLEKVRVENRRGKLILFSSWLIVFGASYYVYLRAGVMRDLPEMGVTKENPYAVRNTEYIDRIFSYNKPFTSNKTKVLVIGNSFARDFACTLEEWDMGSRLEISYMLNPVQDDKRFEDADFIFFFGNKKDVPEWVWDSTKNGCEVYGIGIKNFGKTFGTIYRNKGTDNYYNSSLPIPQLLKETNEIWKESWGNHYIDFVSASLNEKGEIRLFTPDSMIISFDCQHLAPAGAIYFSSRLGFDKIFPTP